MTDRAFGRLNAAALLLLVLAPGGCRSAPPSPAGGGGGLDEGPTRWLMLPEEERQYRRLHTTREAVDFIESFWRRRDPDPIHPGNEFAKAFYDRVEAADRLYSDGGIRGSLTDRGRALILLGPPPVLRYGQKNVPSWEPGKPGAPPNVQTRTIILETWAYPIPELPPALAEQIQKEDPLVEVVLVFATEPRHTYLIEGGKFLEMAVRAALRDDDPQD